jgi:hypothetical protein
MGVLDSLLGSFSGQNFGGQSTAGGWAVRC